MTRSYRSIRPLGKKVYTVNEVMCLFGVSRNTISNWVGEGLSPSDTKIPRLFQGAELARFHRARARPRRPVGPGEVFCLGCRSGVLPQIMSDEGASPGAVGGGSGMCPRCRARVSLLLPATDRDEASEQLDPNTSLGSTDEAAGPSPACIGKDRHSRDRKIHFANDRILQAWQVYAGRYDPKTIDAHLTAIREFEHFIGGCGFDRVSPEDVDRYRKDLIERSKRPTEDGGLRRSTLRHRASNLKSFFVWLGNQDGYRHLNRSLPDYFALPRGSIAADLELPPKPYPTLDDAIAMLRDMPNETLIERRARTIVSMAFAFGLRSAALISLKGKHLDTEDWIVEHDGCAIRAKNGKSYRIFAFPRTAPFREVVRDWVRELHSLGLAGTDALFPSDRDLRRAERGDLPDGSIVAPMKTTGAVTAAFQEASRVSGCHYTPHSARHCLAALGRNICRPTLETKAWSDNLGHPYDQITDRHYGKITEVQRELVMKQLASPQHFTEAEKDLMLDYHGHRLHPGTVEFERARSLVRKREQGA